MTHPTAHDDGQQPPQSGPTGVEPKHVPGGVGAAAGSPSIAYGTTSPSVVARLGRRSGSSGLNGAVAESSRTDPVDGASPAEPPRRHRPPHHQARRPGARQETLRESNLLLITEEIFSAAEPPSRADLSIRTGMTRSTVSRLVDDLLTAGIVREGSPIVGGTRGRPAVPLLAARRTLVGLGIEVNVDFMAARALDLTGEVLAEEVLEGDFRGSDAEEVLPQTGQLARRVADAATAAGAEVVGSVIALPGLVSDRADQLLLAPNLGWRGVDVVSLLCRDGAHGLGGFVLIANEAKVAALAVAQELTAVEQQEQTFFYVSARMGIGAAVVIDGVVDAGPRGWAGEIGHISVEPGGPQCGCGATGCLEVFAGKHALMAAAGLDSDASAHQLVSLAHGEDGAGERARRAIDRAGWALGIALSGAVNLLDVDQIVLGGGFGPLADLLRPRIAAELQHRVLASEWSSFRVRETATDVAPATTGGALLALRAVVEAPMRWVPEDAAQS